MGRRGGSYGPSYPSWRFHSPPPALGQHWVSLEDVFRLGIHSNALFGNAPQPKTAVSYERIESLPAQHSPGALRSLRRVILQAPTNRRSSVTRHAIPRSPPRFAAEQGDNGRAHDCDHEVSPPPKPRCRQLGGPRSYCPWTRRREPGSALLQATASSISGPLSYRAGDEHAPRCLRKTSRPNKLGAPMCTNTRLPTGKTVKGSVTQKRRHHRPHRKRRSAEISPNARRKNKAQRRFQPASTEADRCRNPCTGLVGRPGPNLAERHESVRVSIRPSDLSSSHTQAGRACWGRGKGPPG